MKASFTADGTLLIEAENHTDRVALKAWHNGFQPDCSGCASVISFDWNGYKQPEQLPHIQQPADRVGR